MTTPNALQVMNRILAESRGKARADRIARGVDSTVVKHVSRPAEHLRKLLCALEDVFGELPMPILAGTGDIAKAAQDLSVAINRRSHEQGVTEGRYGFRAFESYVKAMDGKKLSKTEHRDLLELIKPTVGFADPLKNRRRIRTEEVRVKSRATISR